MNGATITKYLKVLLRGRNIIIQVQSDTIETITVEKGKYTDIRHNPKEKYASVCTELTDWVKNGFKGTVISDGITSRLKRALFIAGNEQIREIINGEIIDAFSHEPLSHIAGIFREYKKNYLKKLLRTIDDTEKEEILQNLSTRLYKEKSTRYDYVLSFFPIEIIILVIDDLVKKCEIKRDFKRLRYIPLSQKYLYDFLKRNQENLRKFIALSNSAHGALLDKLSRDSVVEVRRILAMRDHGLLDATICKLATDEDAEVRETIVNRGNYPRKLLFLLAADKNAENRMILTKRYQLPLKILVILAADREKTIPVTLVQNAELLRQLPSKALVILSEYGDHEINTQLNRTY